MMRFLRMFGRPKNLRNPRSQGGKDRDLRKLSSDIQTHYISETGTQKTNRDYFGYIPLDSYICWVIAESYDNDEVVSAKIAVETVLEQFAQNPTISAGRLKSYIQEANKQLLAQTGQHQRKASIMVVVSDYKKMRYAQCGICRLYMFRGGRIFMRSDDHSLMGYMVNEGIVPDDEIHAIEESRNLTSFLGKDNRAEIFASKKFELEDDDVLLLSSWGLWENLTVLEMLDALENAKTPSAYTEELQELLLSKQETTIIKKGRNKKTVANVNNYTAATTFINKTYVEINKRRKYIKMLLMIALPIIIIALIFSVIFITQTVRRNRIINTIYQHESQGDIHFLDQNFSRAFAEYDQGTQESRGLRERRGRRGARNEEIREALSARQRVAQLIIDGDELFNAGRYDAAKLSYQAALQEARLNLDVYDLLDTAAIEERITRCEDHAFVNSLVSLASVQSDLGQYADALTSFYEARDLAMRIGNRGVLTDIRLSISELTSRLNAQAEQAARLQAEVEEVAHAENLRNIEQYALAGDGAAANQDFAMARMFYERAAQAFITNGEFARASDMRNRIAEINIQEQRILHDLSIESIEQTVFQGEMALAHGDYNRAINIFQQASWDFTYIGESAQAATLQHRIIDVLAQQQSAEQGRIVQEIELAVVEGDLALASGDFNRALLIFEQAVIDFTALGDAARVSALRFRIIEAEAARAQTIHNAALLRTEVMARGGVSAIAEGRYEHALSILNAARLDFIAIGESLRAADIQLKIIELEEIIRQAEEEEEDAA